MKSQKLTFRSVLAIGFIFICTAAAWFILAGALEFRSAKTSMTLDGQVREGWGPFLVQSHPEAWFLSPTARDGKQVITPQKSDIDVSLAYEPKRKGLLWYRTYQAQFEAHYAIPNPTPIDQTVYVSFRLPSTDASYNAFTFDLEGAEGRSSVPKKGRIVQAVVIPARGAANLRVAYHARGLDGWEYRLGDTARVQNFALAMVTDFDDINFPEGTGSPTSPQEKLTGEGWQMVWDYPDVIGAQSIGMDMPKVLNAGPVASRISFFAPVSLLFFFAVLLILGAVSGVNLHPMNYFFLAAGCFAFQLLFAYTVDLLPLHFCFFLSAIVSLVLVNAYLQAVAGWRITRISVPAQLAYMVLFSYSFFFDGLSGLTIAVGAIATLAVLMIATAKMNWSEVFLSRKQLSSSAPPVLPQQDGESV